MFFYKALLPNVKLSYMSLFNNSQYVKYCCMKYRLVLLSSFSQKSGVGLTSLPFVDFIFVFFLLPSLFPLHCPSTNRLHSTYHSLSSSILPPLPPNLSSPCPLISVAVFLFSFYPPLSAHRLFVNNFLPFVDITF